MSETPDTMDVVTKLVGRIDGHMGHQMAADSMGDIYCLTCGCWLTDDVADDQDKADGLHVNQEARS